MENAPPRNESQSSLNGQRDYPATISPPEQQKQSGGHGMRRWWRFPAAILGFALLWLCVRFPYEALGIAKTLVTSPNQIEPLTLHLQGEFVESNLGTALNADGSATVRLIAEQFLFVPHCVTVPAGRPVHFRITSADVVHRFSISGADRRSKSCLVT